MVSLSGLLVLVAALLPTHAAFEEKDIQCQDPFDPSKTVSVRSSLICNEFQNCFQALDEKGDLCGNMYGVQLRENRQEDLSIYFWWDVVHYRGGIWGSSAEERRAAIFGVRQQPDGYFLTRKSDTDSFTETLRGPHHTSYSVHHLRPWTNYTFFLRPYIHSEENALGYRIGTASTVTIRTGFSDPQDVTAVILENHMAVVSWKALGYVERFEVQVLGPEVTCGGCAEEYATWEEITVRGEDADGPRLYSAIVHALPPEAVFRVKSCMKSDCSSHRDIRKGTTKSPEPVPTILRLGPGSDSSFVLHWRVHHDDQESYRGIDIHYCEHLSRSCYETTEGPGAHSLTVGNLLPNATYAVTLRPRLAGPGRTLTLGKPASDIVTTWPRNHLELQPADKPVLSEPDAALYAWMLYGSSLGYLQFSLNSEEWRNCSELVNCSITVLRPHHGRPHLGLSSLSSGTLRLWNLQPYTTYTFSVRACNDDGCGDSISVRHTTEVRESSPPTNLVLTSLENGTSIVRWEPPLHPAGPLDGYKVSRKCPGKRATYTEVTGTEAVIEDLPEGGNCNLSVLAYHHIGEGYTLFGEPSYWDFEAGTWTEDSEEIQEQDPFAEVNPGQEVKGYYGGA